MFNTSIFVTDISGQRPAVRLEAFLNSAATAMRTRHSNTKHPETLQTYVYIIPLRVVVALWESRHYPSVTQGTTVDR